MEALRFWGSTSFLYAFRVEKYRFKVETGHFPRNISHLPGITLYCSDINFFR